jgi:CRP/FNR family cyclic AMP-dependent transcriptional regulator
MEFSALLESVPLFRGLSRPSLRKLSELAVRQLYEPGEVIFRQGDPPDSLYVVESGLIDIAVGSEVDEIVVATFAPGSFFGELAVFDQRPRNATARAAEGSSVLALPGLAVIAMIERDPAAVRQLLAAIAQRLRDADELMSRLQIRNINDELEERMTVGARLADGVAHFGGSWGFILLFFFFLLVWMFVNTTWLLRRPLDPFPYIFLNLMLSCIAAVQAPIIMMSQNRHSLKDRLQADMDYQVNIRAEHAVQQLHRKSDELRAMLLQEQVARRPTTVAKVPRPE